MTPGQSSSLIKKAPPSETVPEKIREDVKAFGKAPSVTGTIMAFAPN